MLELRKSGIDMLGDIPRGSHFCNFYETKQDLLDTLVAYFKAGLESKEFCLWVVPPSELITVEEAKIARVGKFYVNFEEVHVYRPGKNEDLLVPRRGSRGQGPTGF